MSIDCYFDHNVSADVIPLLRALGYNVLPAIDVGLAAADDDEQLLFAAQQQRVLITYNVKDFELLHDAWRRWSLTWHVTHRHGGILILPQPPRWDAERAAEELHAFFQASPVLSNELYHYRTGSGWNRRP